VLREIGMPPVIYGGLLTIGMVRSKLDEHKLGDAPLQELPAGRRCSRALRARAVHLSHSIPDMRGVLLSTELGSVLMTGDYKFDQTPVDGRPGRRLPAGRARREGLLLLCGDSTNADRPGWRRRSRASARRCSRPSRAARADHRHLLRLQHPPRPAGDRRRRPSSTAVSPSVGRSMRKNFNIASNLGIASGAGRASSSRPRRSEDFPDEKVGRDLDGQPG
jgi:ribonuclease J